MTFKTYSAQETAQALGIDRHLLPVLHDTGLLLGIKTGKGRRYSEEEITLFWRENVGADLSNAENIRLAAAFKRMKGKKKNG